MTRKDFTDLLSLHLGYEPTDGQLNFFSSVCDFLSSDNFNEVFLLKGYAGTGKTSVISALVKTLQSTTLKTVLLAPTGRAAKVMSNYAQKSAFTIHRMIYAVRQIDGRTSLALKQNKFQKTLFIVDEASMIGSDGGEDYNQRDLLEDLFLFVNEGIQCKLLLIGDEAQLPPVGLNISPALDVNILKTGFFVEPILTEMNQVVRQKSTSGILLNATLIRDSITKKPLNWPLLQHEKFKDVNTVDGYDLPDVLNSAYDKYGRENVLIVTRSNKNANQYNRQIRSRVFWLDNQIASGDLVMSVKNNYFWIEPSEGEISFIANGEMMEIMKLGNVVERYGALFADATVRFCDYNQELHYEVKLNLSSLDSNTSSMSFNEIKAINTLIEEDYLEISNKRERWKQIKKDSFYNALQVKFAYAVTCHKAQGGQWPCVFVDLGYMPNELPEIEDLRWLYTAVSRASEELYLVNFRKDLLEGDE